MSTTAAVKPSRSKPARAVKAPDAEPPRVCWPHFDRVNATRLKLKGEVSRTLYAVLHLLADEFAAQATTITARGPEMTTSDVGAGLFARHASSAYRMAADRLLKTFTLTDMIRAERYGMEEWAAAVARLNRPGNSPT